jgi:hypothetical protein
MDDSTLRLDEASARQLVLVRAIDDIDTRGLVLSEIEREQLERDALEASRRASASPDLDRGQYLQQRARKLLAAVENRHPQLAALQDPEPWRRWLLWAAPLAACILGALIDRIDNPQQVNMLSPPLLGVLLWNLAIYVLLLAGAFLPASRNLRGPVAAVQRWLARVPGHGRRTGRLRVDVSARFYQQWLQATGRQQVLWGKQLLHLAAGGWALGLALSIVLGGLVRQYRVGWESTLLDLSQVHAFLRVLFAPVVALLPFDAFSVGDLQRMAFHAGARVPVDEARRWVWMYLALLFLVVLLPRALLAAWTAFQRRRLGRSVRIDLRDPYFVQVLARVSPARVTLGVLAQDASSRARVLQVLQQAAERTAPPMPQPWTVLGTAKGDVLRVFEIPPDFQPPVPAVARVGAGPAAAQAWLQDLLGRFKAAPAGRGADCPLDLALADTDLVLLLPATPADLDAAARLLHWMAQPALVLVRATGDDDVPTYEAAARRLGLAAQVLALDAATGDWLRETALLDAITARVAPSKRPGLARVTAAWNERATRRFEGAMHLLADLLLRAARSSEEVGSGALGLRQLVDAGEREAGLRAREAAARALAQRLRALETSTVAELMRLHRLDAPAAPLLGARLEGGFVVQQGVDAPQAGVAGAATGAAMGAGIDLMTGGLTLGAAAALGAVLGGGGAALAAAWRNRGAPAGHGLLQPGDELLQTLTESALLAYLGIASRTEAAHHVGVPPAWRSEAVAAVEARRGELAVLWAQARDTGEEERVLQPLADELGLLARSLLART